MQQSVNADHSARLVERGKLPHVTAAERDHHGGAMTSLATCKTSFFLVNIIFKPFPRRFEAIELFVNSQIWVGSDAKVVPK